MGGLALLGVRTTRSEGSAEVFPSRHVRTQGEAGQLQPGWRLSPQRRRTGTLGACRALRSECLWRRHRPVCSVVTGRAAESRLTYCVTSRLQGGCLSPVECEPHEGREVCPPRLLLCSQHLKPSLALSVPSTVTGHRMSHPSPHGRLLQEDTPHSGGLQTGAPVLGGGRGLCCNLSHVCAMTSQAPAPRGGSSVPECPRRVLGQSGRAPGVAVL